MNKYAITLRYRKQEEMKYFSQLDLSRIFERALRRAGLPFYLSQGFRPRVKMSFGPALKLGREGESLVTFYLREEKTPAQLLAALGPQLPAGLILLEVEPVNG